MDGRFVPAIVRFCVGRKEGPIGMFADAKVKRLLGTKYEHFQAQNRLWDG